MPLQRKPRHSKAVLALAAAGVTTTEIADRLSRSRTLVTRMLNGERTAHPDLLDVIADLAGAELADQVAEALVEVRG
jgi:hypothetical protein